MVEIATSIQRSIDTFLRAARERYTLIAVYLYGSYAKGTATQWSDIDLALISPTFSEEVFDEQVKLMQLAATIDDRIEPYPFTETTFTVNSPLAYEIQRHGIRVYPQPSSQ